LTAINALAGMGILTDDDGLIDAALSELKSLPLDLRHRRDPRRDYSYILKQHHLGQVSDLARPVPFRFRRLLLHIAPAPQGKLTAALSEAQKAVHVEPAREDARRTLATLLLQCSEPAAAAGALVSSQRGEGDIGELRESIGLRAVAKALSRDKGNLNEAWSMAQKGVMLAPWDRRSWEVLAYLRSRR
jgi:superkiller protein 3